ncbi:MAG: hypothetical protein V4457_06145 [Pseudomonadota bacterium]
MKRLHHYLTLFAFALVLTGCASLGTEKADTFKTQLAYAEGIHSAVVDATTSSVNAGTLSSADAETVGKGADNAQLILVSAKTAYAAGDTAGANAKLATALTALQALQDYLRAHGAAHAN